MDVLPLDTSEIFWNQLFLVAALSYDKNRRQLPDFWHHVLTQTNTHSDTMEDFQYVTSWDGPWEYNNK